VVGTIPDAFAEFVTAKYASLARTAYLLVGDRGHAEDLVQSALLSTMRAWERLAAPDAAESYTRTTMVRLAGKWARRRWRNEIPSDFTEDHDAATNDAALALDIQTALKKLPLPQRAVIVLRFFDDLSERETAAALGCSEGTVKSRTSRALARLRASGLLEETEQGAHHD
jgi:RNA polymerase sigma-70 factor (sigma-E family)